MVYAGSRNTAQLKSPPVTFTGGSLRSIVLIYSHWHRHPEHIQSTHNIGDSKRNEHDESENPHSPLEPKCDVVEHIPTRCALNTHPTSGKRFFPTTGKTIPPNDDPAEIMPRTNPDFFENQWRTSSIAGPNMMPPASCQKQLMRWGNLFKR